jgi:hypothetical protein
LGTQWLPDAFGPDTVRVTIGVEPAVERLVRERDQWMVPRLSLLPRRLRLWNRLPAMAQDTLLDNAWAVVVEADSGERVRLTRPTREEAWQVATSVSDAVHEHGVAALSDLR